MNSVKVGNVLTASLESASAIGQLDQQIVLEKRERYEITLNGTFIFHTHFEGAPEDIYEVDSVSERRRVFVKSAKPIGGKTTITITFDR